MWTDEQVSEMLLSDVRRFDALVEKWPCGTWKTRCCVRYIVQRSDGDLTVNAQWAPYEEPYSEVMENRLVHVVRKEVVDAL